MVGELRLIRSNQSVSLRYAPGWLQGGFALSEDLPLIDEEFLPTERNTAVGAVDDARPDRWGERVIRSIDKPPRLSLLEYLYFAGDDRFGALGISTSAAQYLPRRLGPLPTLGEADQLHELVHMVQENEPVPPELSRLISPGATMGGARPKALRAAGEPFGHPELAQLLRRTGVAEGERYIADMRELFRRMVFNMLMDNTDDHEKNHAFIVTDRQQYELSPAYDVLPSGQALGFQQMRVGEQDADSTLDNALSMSALFSLKRDDAIREESMVARVVSGW